METQNYRVLSIGEFGMLLGICRKCGAVIADPDQHDAFHLALEVTAFAARVP